MTEREDMLLPLLSGVNARGGAILAAMDTVAAISAIGDGRSHPDAIKEAAFQLWAFRSGRNAAKAAALLATEEFGGHVIPARTIRHWAASDNWAILAAERIRAIAPSINETDASELLVMRASALAYLRLVVDGGADLPDVSGIDPESFVTESGGIDHRRLDLALTAAVKAHATARKDRITACFGVLDRSGFGPAKTDTGNINALTGNKPAAPSSSGIRPLSDEERERMARRFSGEE